MVRMWLAQAVLWVNRDHSPGPRGCAEHGVGHQPWVGVGIPPRRGAGGAEPPLPPRITSACSRWTTRSPPSSCACWAPTRRTPTTSPAPVSAGREGGSGDGTVLPRRSSRGL